MGCGALRCLARSSLSKVDRRAWRPHTAKSRSLKWSNAPKTTVRRDRCALLFNRFGDLQARVRAEPVVAGYWPAGDGA